MRDPTRSRPHQHRDPNTSPTKLALVSHALPPSWSGQAVVIFRLLRDWQPQDYCLLSRHDYEHHTLSDLSLPKLSGRYYYIPTDIQFRGEGLLAALEFASLLWEIFQRARRIADIVRTEKSTKIVACSGDLVDLPAGYMASRMLRLGFCAYIFDDFANQWVRPMHRFYAKRLEPLMLKGAESVIVPNEFLRDRISSRYGINPAVIHNPCDSQVLVEEPAVGWPGTEEQTRIVYTGAIYHAQYDAFRNLVTAVTELHHPDMRIHIYTAQDPKELEDNGISGPVTFHPHLPPEQIFSVQRRADILFLPLAFNSPITEVIRTSAPGKMGEYLAAGRPILVHAPSDSFVSWYFKKYNCGMVVDKDDSSLLAATLERIAHDEGLRESLKINAQQRADIDFDVERAKAAFLQIVRGQRGH